MFGRLCTRSATSGSGCCVKRAVTSGRSARAAVRSNPVSRAKTSVAAAPTIAAAVVIPPAVSSARARRRFDTVTRELCGEQDVLHSRQLRQQVEGLEDEADVAAPD